MVSLFNQARLLACLMFIWSLLSPPCLKAQYLFLDVNGDGRNDEADQLPHTSWSEVGVWLDTGTNRNGSKPSEQRTVQDYEFVLVAGADAVEWGRYTPSDPDDRIARGPLEDSLTFYVAVEGARPKGIGKHKLGTLRLRPRWGQAQLNAVPCRVIGPDAVWTSFRDRRGGQRFRLGPTVDVKTKAVIPGEWEDADGVAFSDEPRPSAGPIDVEKGTLYLGWHQMKAPYELRIVRGRAVVSGFALPERVPPQTLPRPPITSAIKAQYYADVYSGAVALTLRELGFPDSAISAGFAKAYRLSPAIDSVAVHGEFLRIYARESTIPFYSIGPLRWGKRPRGTWRGPEHALTSVLEGWAQTLRSGHMLRIETIESQVSGGNAVQLETAIRKLRIRERLSPEDSVALRGAEPDTSSWREIADPPSLERVSP
jgi:hypothetical protein